MEYTKEVYKEQYPSRNYTDAELYLMSSDLLLVDANLRRRMKRYDRRLPEFHTAFFVERDFIMAKCIAREISEGALHVVAVVGLAHVPGMMSNLQKFL